MSTGLLTRARWLLVSAALTVLALPMFAATLPSGFTETTIASGLANPTAMAFSPDGRLFVCKQTGQLRVIENNQLLATPFVSLTVDSSGERGLLGVAFDPNFTVNQFVYLYYTATSPTTHNRVSRFTASGNVAVGGETVLLDLPTLSATNHNGGAMHFGLDGKLYIAVGDNAVGANSQSLTTPLGKMLRINADGTIPSTNPFFTQTTGINRAIWALGLRNPFTFTFEPTSGRMFINDVGQNTWEEINDGIAGANYGWPTTEGATTNPSFKTPVYAYPHTGGAPGFQGCAITGGAFYAALPAQFPAEYVGDYFFADYCSGWINRLDDSGPEPNPVVSAFATGIASPVDLAVGPDGGLYYLARGSTGVVVRITFTGSQAPAITQHPANSTVSVGQSASFTVAASGAPPLSYQWQRNGTPISGATSATYTLPTTTLADSGAQFRAVVTNASGSATSNAATLTVVANQPPVPTITAPAQYSAGTTLNFSGSATDPEDGTVPASRFTWLVEFRHGDHGHPAFGPATGSTSGSYVIPRADHTESNVFYRVHLTVTDSAGQTGTTFKDVQPRLVTLTLASSPSGASLTLDGPTVLAPHTFTSVVGVERAISAPLTRTVGNKTYDFTGWSDGGARSHTITTPSANQTITANYQRRKGRP